MRLQPRGIGILRGDGDAHGPDRQAFRERAAELVLGGDDGRGHAGLSHGRQDGGRLELFVACHHHRLVGAAIQIEIAGDAMHRGRRAGDEGAVVRVGEAWQRRRASPRTLPVRYARSRAVRPPQARPRDSPDRSRRGRPPQWGAAAAHRRGRLLRLFVGGVLACCSSCAFRAQTWALCFGSANDFFAAKRGQKFPGANPHIGRPDIVRDRRPPFRMLACFEALARLGSRQTAAAELNVTEGAVANSFVRWSSG